MCTPDQNFGEEGLDEDAISSDTLATWTVGDPDDLPSESEENENGGDADESENDNDAPSGDKIASMLLTLVVYY